MTTMHMSRSINNATSIRSATPLDDAQMMRVAPSIFADDKHDSRSDRYTYVPTIDVLNGLRKEGFQPFFACQARCRDEGKREFTKHMLRLRRVGDIGAQEANEIVLLNSHDGTSSYQMVAGMLRFVCQNGLICGDDLQDIKVRHSGDIIGNVIEGAYTVLDQFALVGEQKEGMQSIVMPREAQLALANAAIVARWDEDEHVPVTPDQLLRPRRTEDAQRQDLWTTFNRVQENMIKGGLRGTSANGQRRATRAVTGIAQDMKLNRALWTLAEAMRGHMSHREV